MITNARMLVGLPLLTVLLSACSVNAPVTNDIHDNYVEIPNMTVNTPDWKNSVPSNPNPTPMPTPSNPLADVDPNAKQDLPEPWGEDDVDPAPTFSPPNT